MEALGPRCGASRCWLIVVLLLANWAVAWLSLSSALSQRAQACTCPPAPTCAPPETQPAVPCAPSPPISAGRCFTDLELLQTFSLEPPPRHDVPSLVGNRTNEYFSQVGQDRLVDELLGRKTNGFFIESGAYDGLVHSNTLFLEITRNWTGVLVEPNPRAYHELVVRDRHVHTVRACLSPQPRFEVLEFMNNGEIGGVMDDAKRHAGAGGRNPYIFKSHVPCYPIGTILKALNRTTVDYFSLDVEGAELAVLRTFPWAEVTVLVWTVEHVNPTAPLNPALLDELVLPHGYAVCAAPIATDRVYYHRSITPPPQLCR